MLRIEVEYDPEHVTGTFRRLNEPENGLWYRLRQSAAIGRDCLFLPGSLRIPWSEALALIREYAPLQDRYNFRFEPVGQAGTEVARFAEQYKSVSRARRGQMPLLTSDRLNERLQARGFTSRRLTKFQSRDLSMLLALDNGANFSVPGAGKTTVIFALNLLLYRDGFKLLVVCPKSAFPAWCDVVRDCIGPSAPSWAKEPFAVLTGSTNAVRSGLEAGHSRLVMNYEQVASNADALRRFLVRHDVHLVLDESHRIKGGRQVARGATLLNLAPLALRRDILSGTPMPQSSRDLQSQLDFLWPGTGLGGKIGRGSSPRSIVGRLYVRTTKDELALPPVDRVFEQVPMGPGQLALYGIVRSETLRQLSSFRHGRGNSIIRARRSVMRLLQLSTNPVLALNSIMRDSDEIDSRLVEQVLDDGPSPKMVAVRDYVRQLASEGRKSVIWTIFTDSIQQLELMLADLEPVSIYGAVPSGDASDPDTREGRLERFHADSSCMALIANPAAAGEGISLHRVCHDAVYLDRSYNATHYMQSVDRIHRLGLTEGTVTNVRIFQTKTPQGLGSIDYSVNRRLRTKIEAMYQLLHDKDLRQLALDEEEAGIPVDYGIDLDDVVDLIRELQGSSSHPSDIVV